MFLLVNLEGHADSMADIINELVNKYSVPVSIFDSVEKACPNCKGQSGLSIVLKDPDLPPISPATRTEIIDVKPSTLLLETVNDSLNVGRRTAAKQSAIARALEKRADVEEFIETKSFGDFQKLLEQAGCSRETESPTNSYTPNTEDVNSPHDSSVEAEENSEDFGVTLETMHPTLLACLISSTPNVFAQDGSQSPSDTPPNLTPELGFSAEESSLRPNRALGQLISSSGKLRRGRIVYNSRDLNVLESFYSKDPNACADPIKKQQMMDILGVDALRLKVWFQNRRRKDKIRSIKPTC